MGRSFSPQSLLKVKEKFMKKIIGIVALLSVVCVVAGCCKCEVEPIVESNHKLIVPPNFGNMPK